MGTQIQPLTKRLFFWKSSTDRIEVPCISLILETEAEKTKQCRLVFEADYCLYQEIESEELFDLRPQFKADIFGGQFLDELPLQITILLDPDLLPKLGRQYNDAGSVANYIDRLSQKSQFNQLIQTNSWVALLVKQIQTTGEVGFRTFWDYLDISKIAEEEGDIAEDLFSGAILNFFQDSVNSKLSAQISDERTREASAKTATKLIEKLLSDQGNLLEKETGISSSILETLDLLESLMPTELSQIIRSETLAEVDSESFLNLEKNSVSTSLIPQKSLRSTVIEFLQEDDWDFEEAPDQTVLYLLFQGKYGKWRCLAHISEADQQFCFYSISPVKAQTVNTSMIAELLMRLNWALSIGNFDLDFQSGEIRYKTSIDVENSHLDSSLVKNLIYINVLTMDKCLPYIMSLIEDNKLPENLLRDIKLY